MAPPTQRGLLFHWRNRVSRTNCCFQLALMVADDRIIIQQERMAANCSASAAFSLFSSRKITTKGFHLTESMICFAKKEKKKVGFKIRGLICSLVPVMVMFCQASKWDASFSGSTLTPSMWSVHHCTHTHNMQCVCFSSFVNDFSLNLRCTLPKKCFWRNVHFNVRSAGLRCPFKTQFWLFHWKLPFTNQIFRRKDPASIRLNRQSVLNVPSCISSFTDLLMGELQDVPGQMGDYSTSSIFWPWETCFPICCIPLCDALKTF